MFWLIISHSKIIINNYNYCIIIKLFAAALKVKFWVPIPLSVHCENWWMLTMLLTKMGEGGWNGRWRGGLSLLIFGDVVNSGYVWSRIVDDDYCYWNVIVIDYCIIA